MSESQQGPEICDVISRKRYRGVHAHSCIMGNQGKMAGN